MLHIIYTPPATREHHLLKRVHNLCANVFHKYKDDRSTLVRIELSLDQGWDVPHATITVIKESLKKPGERSITFTATLKVTVQEARPFVRIGANTYDSWNLALEAAVSEILSAPWPDTLAQET